MDDVGLPLQLDDEQRTMLLQAQEKAAAVLTYCKRLREAGIPLPEHEEQAASLHRLSSNLVNVLVNGQRPRRR